MLKDIIKTAMLGTERSFPEKNCFPPYFEATYERIIESDLTREEKFLQLTSYVFQMQQSATKAAKWEDDILLAPKETKQYASAKANKMLQNYIEKKDKLLIFYTLCIFERVEKLVYPQYIPALLDIGLRTRAWRSVILATCGERAIWLTEANPVWKPLLNWEKNDEKKEEKLSAKKEKKEKNATTEWLDNFSSLPMSERYLLLATCSQYDMTFYTYMDGLMSDSFVRFPADFSLLVFEEVNRRTCSQSKEFYQRLALHLHPSLKGEILELTNKSYNYSQGIRPDVAREMLEILMDKDTLLEAV